MEQIAAELNTNRERLARRLRWPENMGIELRDVALLSTPPSRALLAWVEGLAAADTISQQVLQPLTAYRGPLDQALLTRALPIHRIELVTFLQPALEAVMSGRTLLLVDGWTEGILLDTVHLARNPVGTGGHRPRQDVFSTDLETNVSLLRKRMQTPELLVLPAKSAGNGQAKIALAYMDGKADPRVVRSIRRWAGQHVSEETLSRGLTAGTGSAFGLLPLFAQTRWPDDATVLLDGGYVMLMADRMDRCLTAPVTQALTVLSPDDYAMRYPIRRVLARMRVGMYLLVLTAPGTVVALMNYHQEMLPTGFLLALASTREAAPFGVVFEVLVVELLVDMAREVSFRLPVPVPPGTVIVATILMVLLAVQTGLIGPFPALAGTAGALVSLALPDYVGGYLIRVWRYYLLVGTVILGYFGLATVFIALLTYLCQARSWGVPYMGGNGWQLVAGEGSSSNPPNQKGGVKSGPSKSVVR